MGPVYCVSDVSQTDVNWWSSYRDACIESQHILSALVLALVGRSIVTKLNSKTSVISVLVVCSSS